jgi:hypothetical protein
VQECDIVGVGPTFVHWVVTLSLDIIVKCLCVERPYCIVDGVRKRSKGVEILAKVLETFQECDIVGVGTASVHWVVLLLPQRRCEVCSVFTARNKVSSLVPTQTSSRCGGTCTGKGRANNRGWAREWW